MITGDTGLAEEGRVEVVARAKADLNLDENNADSFYIKASAMSDSKDRGTHEALISLRRSGFHGPFQTMVDLRRINQVEIQAIRDFLGANM